MTEIVPLLGGHLFPELTAFCHFARLPLRRACFPAPAQDLSPRSFADARGEIAGDVEGGGCAEQRLDGRPTRAVVARDALADEGRVLVAGDLGRPDQPQFARMGREPYWILLRA